MNKYFLMLLLFINSLCYGQLQWYPVSNNYLNQSVLTLFTDTTSDKLLIGGNFKYYGSILCKGVAQWDGNQLLNLDCGLGGCAVGFCGGVRQFEKFNNEVYALFYEDSIGCQNIHHIAKWDGSTWINLNQKFYLNSTSTLISFMVNLDSTLVVCGGFDSVNNLNVHGIVKYNGSIWDTAFYCSSFTDDYLLIHPLVKYNNIIYAQNFLIDTNGNSQFFSKWENGCWEKVSGAFSNISGSINKMLVYKNELYLAGSFDPHHDPQAPGYSIARWNGTRWDNLNGGIRLLNPNYLPIIYDMTMYNDELYVVGDFQKAGGLDVSNIAKWDGLKWCSLGSNFDREITSVAFYHDSLFIGGAFKVINNDSIHYIAKCGIGNYIDTCEQVIGIIEFSLNQIKIYPNPSNDILQIECDKIAVDKIGICNILNKEVISKEISEKSCQLDISFLTTGLYFLIIETKEGRVVKKFIKE